jgi:hypothetical protein
MNMSNDQCPGLRTAAANDRHRTSPGHWCDARIGLDSTVRPPLPAFLRARVTGLRGALVRSQSPFFGFSRLFSPFGGKFFCEGPARDAKNANLASKRGAVAVNPDVAAAGRAALRVWATRPGGRGGRDGGTREAGRVGFLRRFLGVKWGGASVLSVFASVLSVFLGIFSKVSPSKEEVEGKAGNPHPAGKLEQASRRRGAEDNSLSPPQISRYSGVDSRQLR